MVTTLTYAVAETRAQNISIGSSVGTTPGIPPVFRLGSGASPGDGHLPEAPAAGVRDPPPAFGTNDGRLADAAVGLYSSPFRLNLEGGSDGHGSTTAAFTLPAPLEQSSPRYLVMTVLLLATISVLGYMVAPGAGTQTGPSASTGLDMFYFRAPPGWSPEHESTYSFSTYMTDVIMLSMLTAPNVSQQCIAITMFFGGVARRIRTTHVDSTGVDHRSNY